MEDTSESERGGSLHPKQELLDQMAPLVPLSSQGRGGNDGKVLLTVKDNEVLYIQLLLKQRPVKHLNLGVLAS